MRGRLDDPMDQQLDAETRFIERTTHSVRRVQLKRGQSWRVRFLPVEVGPRKMWYVRLGQHWHNYKPIVCPRVTSPDYGGDPDAFCPVCEVSERLNDENDEQISKFGFSVRGNPTWVTWCVVFEKDGAEIGHPEYLLPYEFGHYKNSFEELMSFFRNSRRKDNPLGVLDLEKGCDFYANKTGKGIRLDKQEPMPIFDPADPVKFDELIAKIWSEVKEPKIIIPTDQELQRFADKITEAANRGEFDRQRESRGRGRYPEDEGDDNTGYTEGDEQPSRGRRLPDAPTRSSRPTMAPAMRTATPPARRASVPDDDQVPGAEVSPEGEAGLPEQAPEPEPAAPAAPVSRSVGRPPLAARPVAPAPTMARPTPRTTAPAAPTARTPAPRPGHVPAPTSTNKGDRVDDTEEVPEENRDPAPPAAELPPEVDSDSEPANPPPPVARSSNLAGGIRAKIEQARQQRRA